MVSPHVIRDRDRSSQILRATPIVARSMYQELVRAQYSREEVLNFVNKLLEQVQTHPEPTKSTTSSFFDLETGLPDAQATRSILAFECRRMTASARPNLAIAIIELAHEHPTPAIHERLARILRESARSGDAIGRIDSARYLIVPEAGSEYALAAIAERAGAAAAKHERAKLTLRVATFTRGDTAETLLARCLAGPAETIKIGSDGSDRAQHQQKIMLALGGGAARAAAHVGVLRSLQAAKIEIAGIAGSSGGALVGAMFAMGLAGEEILARFTRFATSPLLREMRRAFAASRRAHRAGVSDGSALIPDHLYAEMIETFAGTDRNLSSLAIPFSATATDLVEGRAIELASGSLHAALRASCAIPGLFPAQKIKNRLLVDGAMIAEIPLSTSLAGQKTIPLLSVFLARPASRIARFDTRNDRHDFTSRLAAISHEALVRAQLAQCERLLSVPVEEHGWLGFRNAREIAAIGENAAADFVRHLDPRTGD